VEKTDGERQQQAEEHPPPKIAPGPKLPKPAVPHVYVTPGWGFASEERMPPES
jgi:hypothetical protein